MERHSTIYGFAAREGYPCLLTDEGKAEDGIIFSAFRKVDEKNDGSRLFVGAVDDKPFFMWFKTDKDGKITHSNYKKGV